MYQKAATEPLLSRPILMGIDEQFLRAVHTARRFLRTHLATDDKSHAQKVLFPDDKDSGKALRTWEYIVAKAVPQSSPTWTDRQSWKGSCSFSHRLQPWRLMLLILHRYACGGCVVYPAKANYKLFKRTVWPGRTMLQIPLLSAVALKSAALHAAERQAKSQHQHECAVHRK